MNTLQEGRATEEFQQFRDHMSACLDKREVYMRKGGEREVEESSRNPTCVQEGKRTQSQGTTEELL